MNINDFTVRMPKTIVSRVITLDIIILGIMLLLLIDNPILPSLVDVYNTMYLFLLVLFIIVFGSVLPIVLYSRWKIHVKDNKFYFCPGIGPSRHFTLEDIKRVKYDRTDKKFESITLYSEDEALATAKSNYPGYDLLLEHLVREGILHEDQKLSQDSVDVS